MLSKNNHNNKSCLGFFLIALPAGIIVLLNCTSDTSESIKVSHFCVVMPPNCFSTTKTVFKDSLTLPLNT